tara:strand:- start:259 stop:759 length:501 start_codon:yes stop_codon:yes gene_type:complete
MADLPIHYAAAKAPLLVLGVLALCMTAVGLAVVGGPVGWLTGGPAALFFGACTVVIFYRALASAPVLSLTHEGVRAWRYPPLTWDEIDFAEAAESSGELFLVIHAKDHESYVRRFTFFKRKWAQLSAKLMQGSVYLSLQMFEVQVPEVAKVINAELALRRGGGTRR